MPLLFPLLVLAGAVIADRWRHHVRIRPGDMPCVPLYNDGLVCQPQEPTSATVIDVDYED